MTSSLLQLVSNGRSLFAPYQDGPRFTGPEGWDRLHHFLTGETTETARVAVACVRSCPRLLRHFPEALTLPPSTFEGPLNPSAEGAVLRAGVAGYLRMTYPSPAWPEPADLTLRIPGPTPGIATLGVGGVETPVPAQLDAAGELILSWPPEYGFELRLAPAQGSFSLTPGDPSIFVRLHPVVIPDWAAWIQTVQQLPELSALLSRGSSEVRHLYHNPDHPAAWIACLIRLLDELKRPLS